MWFKNLTGFDEISPTQVRENLSVEGTHLTSLVNGRRFQCGTLEIPTLQSLREQAPDLAEFDAQINLREVVADVQALHADPQNNHALFQAASQFNLLEMVGPQVTPERGIDIYEHDFTQGPACAIACGAGTIYRNYFVPVNGQTGQTADNQIDCLDLIGEALGNEDSRLWQMRNGYALIHQEGILQINTMLGKMDRAEREALKQKLKMGIQWDTEVTLYGSGQLVSQAYCSALPVAYSELESFYWERFASLILEATYEATLYAALINLQKTGTNKVYLTLVGGGAFGNETAWVMEALEKSFQKFRNTPLDVKIVSFRRSNPHVQQLLHKLNA